MIKQYPESSISAMSLIASQTLAADAASVTFATIPQTFKHLRLVGSLRSSVAATFDDVGIQLNGDTAGNYQRVRYMGIGNNTGVTVDAVTGSTTAYPSRVIAASINAAEMSPLCIDFPDYTNSAKWKAFIAASGLTDSTVANAQMIHGIGVHTVAAAITSITARLSSGNIVAGSNFSLYGLAA